MPGDVSDGELSEIVHRATGMISGQLDCSTLEALGRLIVRAQSEGVTLDELAVEVLEGNIRFDL